MASITVLQLSRGGRNDVNSLQIFISGVNMSMYTQTFMNIWTCTHRLSWTYEHAHTDFHVHMNVHTQTFMYIWSCHTHFHVHMNVHKRLSCTYEYAHRLSCTYEIICCHFAESLLPHGISCCAVQRSNRLVIYFHRRGNKHFTSILWMYL
jgi:hypothetical protein